MNFIFIVFLLSAATSTSVRSAGTPQSIFKRMQSPDSGQRIQATKKLAEFSYEAFSNSNLDLSVCTETSARRTPDCKYVNHAFYHLIDVYKKFGSEEVNPKSKHFCLGHIEKNGRPVPCRNLNNLGRMIFDLAGDIYITSKELPADSKDFSSCKLKERAFLALDTITNLKVDNFKSLMPYKPLTTENDLFRLAVVRVPINGGIGERPLLHYFLFKKPEDIVLSYKKLIPFAQDPEDEKLIKQGCVWDISNDDPLSLTYPTELFMWPGSSIAIISDLPGCCGGESQRFTFIDLKNDLKKLGTLEFVPPESSIYVTSLEKIKKVLGDKPKFPLKNTEGKVKIGNKEIDYEIN